MRRLSRRLVDLTACASMLLAALGGLWTLAGEPGPTAAPPVVIVIDRTGIARVGGAAELAAAGDAAKAPRAPRAAVAGAGDVAPSGSATAGGSGDGTPGSALAIGADSAQGDAGAGNAAAATGAARVTGQVVVAATKLPPVGQVTVTARFTGRGKVAPARATTDVQGRFELELGPGEWTLSAALEGWASTRARVKLEAGKAQEVSLRLVPARDALVGTVVTADGVPVAGARVTVQRGGRVPVRRRATTDARGAYHVEGLPEGLFTLTAERAGFRPARRRQVPVAEGRGGEAPRLVLHPAASLEGTLRRPEGAPASGVRVTANRGRRELGRATTDAAGRFAFDRLGDGAVELVALADGGALVARGAATLAAGRAVVLDLTLAPAPSIAGRVTGPDGAPRANARVRGTARVGRLRRETRTDADGRYVLERLAAGPWVVELPRSRAPSAARAVVEVGAGQARCDLEARDGTTVRGVVLDGAGAAVRAANVFAVLGGRERARARTDAKGAFTLRGLPEGPCVLLVRARGDALVGEHALPLPHEGLVDGLRLLARVPARVVGRVLDAAGRPLADVTLRLRGGPVRRDARSRADGSFTLAPLYAGEYRLAADAGSLALVARRRGVTEVTVEALVLAVGERDVACELRATDGPPLASD